VRDEPSGVRYSRHMCTDAEMSSGFMNKAFWNASIACCVCPRAT
jgi:hypothetical protein